eukprot:TRINITY_DN27288_c0_g1_i1.p1 TRINITY_DN27288_c0_g1~~TRINITY_DN27288_c0_g1_i1.p1  ORF type:complete len:694 (+),score=81.27 TRINITY_DN27288_c0_g1_i1:229-2082(+)
MHIFIAYSGTAESFSWVLPAPTIPKLSIGSNEVFSRLRRATKPTFKLNWDPTGCLPAQDECPEILAADGSSTGSTTTGGGGVEVLAAGSVGPFDFEVISATSSGDKTAGQVAQEWLTANGYDQPPESAPLLDEYASAPMNHVFVALKLSKDKTTGEIQPLVLEYKYDTDVNAAPCVPLKLTQIAAVDDMPVQVFVLGPHRAVPVNYFEATLKPEAFPWLECASGDHQTGMFGGFGGFSFPGAFFERTTPCDTKYNQMIVDAVNVAEGNAFVTEMSGPTSDFSTLVHNPETQTFDTSALRAITASPGDYLEKLLQEIQKFQFPQQDPLLQAILKAHIPRRTPSTNPKCERDQDFYSPFNLKPDGECFSQLPDSSVWTFNPTLLTDEINNRVILPITNAQVLINSHAKLTRMTCMLDAAQMTVDPLFGFNSELADVPLERTATAKGTCANDADHFSSIEITFADGTKQDITGLNKPRKTCSPIYTDITLPGNPTPLGELRVLGITGQGEVLPDTAAATLANRRTAMAATAMSLMPTVSQHVVPEGGVTDGSLASTAIPVAGTNGNTNSNGNTNGGGNGNTPSAPPTPPAVPSGNTNVGVAVKSCLPLLWAVLLVCFAFH